MVYMMNEQAVAPVSKYTFCDELFSDLHKDAFGFRPGEAGFNRWESLSDDEKQAEWEYMCETMRESELADLAREETAKADFEKAVANMIAIGADDRETAIRWLFDADELNFDHSFDREHYCYRYGLPYSYFHDLAEAA